MPALSASFPGSPTQAWHSRVWFHNRPGRIYTLPPTPAAVLIETKGWWCCLFPNWQNPEYPVSKNRSLFYLEVNWNCFLKLTAVWPWFSEVGVTWKMVLCYFESIENGRSLKFCSFISGIIRKFGIIVQKLFSCICFKLAKSGKLWAELVLFSWVL